MVTVVGLDFGICKGPRFASTSVHLVFWDPSASETGMLLVAKVECNAVIMRASVKIVHHVMSDAVKLLNKKYNNEKYSQGEWNKLGWHDLFDVSNHIQGSFSS